MTESVLILLTMVVLLLLQGFFSGSEIALVNANKYRLRHLASQGERGAQLVLKMFRRPEVLLGTTLVGTNISLVALTTLGTLLMIRTVGEFGDIIAFIVYTPLFLIFGEVVPKSVYQQKADVLAPRIIFPLRFFSVLFYPVVFVFSRLARLAVRLAGVKVPHQNLFITREQVRMMLEGAEAAANVDVFDRDRLIRAVRFADTTVGEVMIPIGEVTVVNCRASTADAVKIARKNGYFRLPVYEDRPGRITGAFALTMWDLLDPNLMGRPMSEFCGPVMRVAQNQPVDEILDDLQNRKDHMAIVIDEFGSAIGMVTLEDVLEQVIGEAVNLGYNFEAHVPRYKGRIDKLGEQRFRIDGGAVILEVVEALGLSLANSDVHTIGGLVMKELRHVPQAGESIVLSGYRFTVETVSDKGIETLIAEPT